MSRLGKRERVFAALDGDTVDRIPVSVWGHMIPAETDMKTLAEASLKFFNDYDLDWMKVNPRASYFAEAWGSEFDLQDYHGVLPRFVRNRFDPFDPGKLQAVDPKSSPVWAEHIELLKNIKKGINGAPFIQTIFSPASVLGYLSGRPSDHSQLAAAKNHSDTLLWLIRNEPTKVHHALGVIADSLASLAVASLEAGADGIFFAITKLAREGGLSKAEFEEFGKPYDFRVLKAVEHARFNLLHACGAKAYIYDVQDYPVRALNWASVGQGNPNLARVRKISNFALVGGVDEAGVLQTGTPDQVRKATRDALSLGGNRKFLLSPGCCVEPDVPVANLKAFRETVESY